MKLWDFLVATFIVGITSFGGGKAFIPIYEKIYVQEYNIINHTQLQEYIGYSLGFPGPISPMLTGIVGFNTFGFTGFFLGLLVLTLPSLTLVCLSYNFLKRWREKPHFIFINQFLQPMIIALLVSVILEFFLPYIKPALISCHYSYLLILGIILLCICLIYLSFIKKEYILFWIFLLVIAIGILILFWESIMVKNLVIFILCTGLSLLGLIKFHLHPILVMIFSASIFYYFFSY